MHDGSPSKTKKIKIKIVFIHQAFHNNNTINDDVQANTFKKRRKNTYCEECEILATTKKT